MTDQSRKELERLLRYQILDTQESFDAYTLMLGTKSVEFACVATHRDLHQLAASIRKRVPMPKDFEE